MEYRTAGINKRRRFIYLAIDNGESSTRAR